MSSDGKYFSSFKLKSVKNLHTVNFQQQNNFVEKFKYLDSTFETSICCEININHHDWNLECIFPPAING